MASDYSLPVNIGNPEEYTVKQLAELISSKVRAILSSPSVTLFIPILATSRSLRIVYVFVSVYVYVYVHVYVYVYVCASPPICIATLRTDFVHRMTRRFYVNAPR